VKVGQEVKEGDHLLTLEAMKMNTFVFAPKAGKVLESRWPSLTPSKNARTGQGRLIP